MFSLFFIRRPIVAFVISILILIVGLIALDVLPVAQFPQISPPSVEVRASYPGGSAEEVEKSVTSVLEDQLNGVEGLLYMDSTSSSDGSARVRLYFDLSRDLDLAAVDVQNRVSVALPSLPESVRQRGVITRKVSSAILQIVSVTSSNPKHDALFLSNFASLNILNELKRIPGVSDVSILGEKRYAMRIWLDPGRMAALGITPAQIAQAIREQNIQVSLGSVGDMASSTKAKYRYTLIAKTRLSSVREFGSILLKINDDGSKVYLRDVARIEMGSENYLSSASLNGKPAAQLAIFQLPDANALDVAKHVEEKLHKLQRRFPKGIKVAATYDTTRFIEISIEEVVQTLFEALVLVLIVVYLFLQSLRATIIPAVAIPISLIGTFIALYLAGSSINTLTLFGLILAIGIVVDDAILVVENVESNLSKDPTIGVVEATKKAMTEIFAPVISTTLVLLAVFVPVTFIPGISGALYKQFAMTIAFSVLISALVALTLSPALAAMILKPENHQKKPSLFFRLFNRGFDALKRGYESSLSWAIRHRILVLGLYLLLLGGTYLLFRTLPTGFLPDEDQGTVIVSAELPPGTILARTEEIGAKIDRLIRKDPAVKDVIAINGYNAITGVVDSSIASFFISLRDWSERTTPELSLDTVLHRLQSRLTRSVPEAQVRVFGTPSIPGISAVGGFDVKLQNLNAMPLEEFKQIAEKFIRALNKDPRIQMAYSSFSTDYPVLYADIDREKVFSFGLKLSDVFDVLHSYLGAQYVNDFNTFGKTYRVFLQADPHFRNLQNDIGGYFVRNAKGEMVPLSSIVTLHKSTGPNSITHFDGYQSITVNGMHNLQGGYSSSDALTAIEEIAARILPPGVGYAFSGLSLQEKEAGSAALYIFLLSFLMVYLFLAAQYESWAVPLMVMLPIPAVMFGALGANMLAGLLNDIYTQIGLVLLIGMAGKNAIIIVEFAKELHESGKGIVESAIEASLLRMRAILMTIFAFLLGISPLVFASGAGAASRQSLGTAVFGGMALSTLLTFYLTPVLFVILEALRTRRTPRRNDA